MSFQMPSRRGEDHPGAKISNADRTRCREVWKGGGRTITSLARQYGVNRRTMGRIVHQPASWLRGR